MKIEIHTFYRVKNVGRLKKMLNRRRRCVAKTKEGTRCKKAWGYCTTPQCLQHHRMNPTKLCPQPFPSRRYVYYK